MEVSLKPKKNLRVVRVATAIALALVIGSVWVGSARADDDHGGGNRRGGDQHHDNDHRGSRGPDVYYAPQPDYYYAPQPNYYAAPEPYAYYAPEPEYSEPAPEGISLFFGL